MPYSTLCPSKTNLQYKIAHKSFGHINPCPPALLQSGSSISRSEILTNLAGKQHMSVFTHPDAQGAEKSIQIFSDSC